MEMIAKSDDNINSPLDWIQIAPVIDTEEEPAV